MAAVLFFSPAPLAAQAGKKPDTQPAYAGSEACGMCHEDIYKAFQKNKHFIVETDKKRGWATRSCESCHGPGAKHAESVSAADIRNPGKLPAVEADRICLACHRNQPTHVARIDSAHQRNEVSCVSCHSVHNATPGPALLRAPAGVAAAPDRSVNLATRINQLCASCHVDVWAQFQRPNHHKLPEGAMSCADCHNPHGSIRSNLLRNVNAAEPVCFSCHGDKRGPFTFEHPSVRLEGCGACHEPHGSANPRMLTRAEVRYVCLECHANIAAPNPALGGIPPAFHDLRSARFQNCAICHVKIHGSNVDRNFLR